MKSDKRPTGKVTNNGVSRTRSLAGGALQHKALRRRREEFWSRASQVERARRRALDLEQRGFPVPDCSALEAQIAERDRLDSTREEAPLIQADDAVELVTDGMSIDAVIQALVDQFRARVAEEVWPTPAR